MKIIVVVVVMIAVSVVAVFHHNHYCHPGINITATISITNPVSSFIWQAHNDTNAPKQFRLKASRGQQLNQ